jgi:hypothetical protein
MEQAHRAKNLLLEMDLAGEVIKTDGRRSEGRARPCAIASGVSWVMSLGRVVAKVAKDRQRAIENNAKFGVEVDADIKEDHQKILIIDRQK